jgi:hypothetical protein
MAHEVEILDNNIKGDIVRMFQSMSKLRMVMECRKTQIKTVEKTYTISYETYTELDEYNVDTAENG